MAIHMVTISPAPPKKNLAMKLNLLAAMLLAPLAKRTAHLVDNLLANDDLIITDKGNTGTYRFLFQQPRRWSVTVKLAF